MNLTLQQNFNSETTIRSILALKDRAASLLQDLIAKFHQKYELKMGYAEFLTKKLLENDLSPLTAYGCLASIKFFGEHITSIVVAPYMKQICNNLQSSNELTDVRQSNVQLLRHIT